MNPNEKKETHAVPGSAKRIRVSSIVKLALSLLTIALCVYSVMALAGVNGLEIFTVHSTLGRIYVRTYRYACLLSGISLLAWIFWAVVLRGRRARVKKPKKAPENS